jgi:hypothetical protein
LSAGMKDRADPDPKGRVSTRKSAAPANEIRERFQADLGRPDGKAKIFRFSEGANQWHNPAIPSPPEGRIAIVTARWAWEAMDAAVSGVSHRTRTRAADGEVVWSWRRDPGAKLAERIPPATVAKEAAHRGDHV